MTRAPSGQSRWRMAGILFVFVWFFFGGIGHFVLTSMFASVVPDYLPMHRAVVLATGVCEIAGALALFYLPLRRVAGLCLLLLTIGVTPVHTEMLRHADHYGALGLPVLWGRLLIQPIVAWIIWAATKPATVDVTAAGG